jgi:hypothetical protein
MRLDGSFKKTGPDRDDELAAAVAEPSPTHAPINHRKKQIQFVVIIIWSSSSSVSVSPLRKITPFLYSNLFCFDDMKMVITGNGNHAFFLSCFFSKIQINFECF